MKQEYIPTIGIETHVQLKTKTKLFAAVDNDARIAKPNTLISPICFGLPGVLPVLNEEAVILAIRAGLALNAEISELSVFDRKHYFYPDLPKGYQISQFHKPIVGHGYLEVPENDELIKIGITRAHLEEDAGKLSHDKGSMSFVDLNRAGTPLLEIVSEPEIHSAKVAKAYVQELYNLMLYAEVTDGDLYHGNMRFDVNISLSSNEKELGTRAEIKNLNSFRSVEKSILFEIERQAKLLNEGEKVRQETRGWDDDKQMTYSQRSKEDAHDYRYFPDPDIPPVVITKEQIDEQKINLPVMPNQRREEFQALGLDKSQIETLVFRKHLGDVLLKVAKTNPEIGKKVANLLTGSIAAYLAKQESNEEGFLLDSKRLIDLVKMQMDGQLNSNAADMIAIKLMTNESSVSEIVSEMNLIQMSDLGELEVIIDKVIEENAEASQDVRNGEVKAIGFLVGQAMKATSGKANPQLVQEMFKKKLR